jgi:hypothetical protein
MRNSDSRVTASEAGYKLNLVSHVQTLYIVKLVEFYLTWHKRYREYRY